MSRPTRSVPRNSLERSIKYHFPSCKIPGDGHFCRKKTRGASATGFTQKRRTLWNQYIRFWENLQMVVVCKNRLPSGGPEWTIFTMTPGRRSYFAYSSPMSQFSVRPGRIRVRNTKN